MREAGTPAFADLLLLGGGHAHVEVLRRLALRPVSGLRVTVLCREPHTPYSGMLPGLTAGIYGFDDAHIDLRRLAWRAGARFLAGAATGLDPTARRVACRDRPPLRYDLLSINTGATPSLDVPGAADHAVPVKPIARFLERWRALRERVAARDGPTRIGVVGGGAGGVELLLAIRRALSDSAAPVPALHLVTRDAEILPGHGAGVVRRLRRALARHGVAVHTGFAVARVEAGAVVDAADRRLGLDEILWVTEAAPARWLAGSGLAVDAHGFLRVGETLASVSHPEVFAAGDVAVVDGHPRPRAGVFAVRQGPVLADNLRRAVEGRKLRRHQPQRRYLALIGTGDGRAVASWAGLGWEGRWVWRWKDRIDRRFMDRYDARPPIAGQARRA